MKNKNLKYEFKKSLDNCQNLIYDISKLKNLNAMMESARPQSSVYREPMFGVNRRRAAKAITPEQELPKACGLSRRLSQGCVKAMGLLEL
ncbi:MAG: hypothetical protein LBS74_02695 [Oscillospiraceae bacterium]|jgi:hypothetical protein|nr:hypothetical protein [Oscillospiraceae bacterium]